KNHNYFENVVSIILDIHVKDGSGIELRYRLKAAGISVPVIYITAKDTPAVRTVALQSGCLDYLLKPFSAESLIALLKRASAEPIKALHRHKFPSCEAHSCPHFPSSSSPPRVPLSLVATLAE